MKELAFNDYLPLYTLEELIEEIKKRSSPLQISNYRTYHSKLLPVINSFQTVILKKYILDNIPIDRLPLQIEVEELIICPGIMSIESCHSRDIFFSRFEKITSLKINIQDSFNRKYLKMLLDNNPIEKFQINFESNCFQLRELVEIIRNRKFKEFGIDIITRRGYSIDMNRFDEFLVDLSIGDLWRELEIFSCLYFPLQSIFDLFSKAHFEKLHTIEICTFRVDSVVSISAVLPSVRKVCISITKKSTIAFNIFLLHWNTHFSMLPN